MKKLVVKLGSSSITGDAGPDPDLLTSAIASAIELRDKHGWSMALVSSGAVSSGRQILASHVQTVAPKSWSKAIAAAVGQPVLQSIYHDVASKSDRLTCQVLIGEDDLRSPERVRAISRLLNEAMAAGVIPIINGNDAVDDQGSDNDAVAAAVATMCDANLLLLLTDTDGVYLHADDKHYARRLPMADLHRVTSSRAGTGKGGIRSKLRAAELAGLNGIPTRIAAARSPGVIEQSVTDDAPGTLIPAIQVKRNRNVKFSVITVSRGSVTINREAELSIQEENSSLFSSGVKRVSGEFARGDVISVTDQHGKLLARGKSNISSQLLQLVRALRRDEVATILISILERLSNTGITHTFDNIQPDDIRRPFWRAMETLHALSESAVSSLGAEILALYPVVAAKLMTTKSVADLEYQIRLVSTTVGELMIVPKVTLEVMPPVRLRGDTGDESVQ